MLALASALLMAASAVGFVASFAGTDFNTGQGPAWTDWLAYGSVAAFCVGGLGLAWAFASWIWAALP